MSLVDALLGRQPWWCDQTAASAWDVLQLNTSIPGDPVVVPGVCRLSLVIEVDYHVGKNQGTDSASVTDRGMKPKRVHAEVHLWKPDHWFAWQTFISNIGYDSAGKTRTPYQLQHPGTQGLGVGDVVIDKIEQGAPNAKDGMRCKLTFLEFKKPVANKPVPPPPAFNQGAGLGPTPGSGGSI